MAQQDKLNNEVVEENVQQGGFDTLFAQTEEQTATNGANQLSKTAALTNLANNISQQILQTVANDWDEYEPAVKASQQSHDAMDDLINDIIEMGSQNTDFLNGTDDEEVEKMIRSQQSKRSRAKSKVMTRENYQTMMVGAIAENLLRIAFNKPKSSGGGIVMKDIGYSDEDLEQLAEYPEDLKKAIRNVQSKKSIMKSKADFNPESPRYQQLLQAEQQLKDIRDRGKAQINKEAQEALEAKKELESLVSKEDVDDMSDAEAKALLSKMRDMLMSK